MKLNKEQKYTADITVSVDYGIRVEVGTYMDIAISKHLFNKHVGINCVESSVYLSSSTPIERVLQFILR